MSTYHLDHSHPDSGFYRKGIDTENVLAPVLDQHDISKPMQQKIWMDAMVGGEEEIQPQARHQPKKAVDEDYYYTYDEEYETRTSFSSMASFLKDSVGRMVGSLPPLYPVYHDFSLRGHSTKGKPN